MGRAGEDRDAVLHAVSAAVLAVTRHLSVHEAFQVIVRAAARLLDARYAALGIPDDQGSFAEFVVEGISDEEWAAIGPLPRQHGMLAAMLRDGATHRHPDIRREPEFEGWPTAHPALKDFLGVPIRSGDEILGIIFLANKAGTEKAGTEKAGTEKAGTYKACSDKACSDKACSDKACSDKAGSDKACSDKGGSDKGGTALGRGDRTSPCADGFTESDQELLTLFAAHAAIALTNARLYERNRELTVVEERNRLARELHDAVAQKLFSLRLTAQAAAALATTDPERTVAELAQVERLAAEALAELRAVIFELRPADLAGDGLVASLRKHVEVLDRVYDVELSFSVTGFPALSEDRETALFRIAQEGLYNALRHAQAGSIEVRLRTEGPYVALEIADDGVGFDAVPPTHGAVMASDGLGLTSMRDRAVVAGGSLTIHSRPETGTVVRVEVPRA
jgi:signal transduction histidine kinase